MRSSGQGLRSFLFDVYFLSNADHLVCTFTSNVGRVAYELMMLKSPDTHQNVRSLDIHYVSFDLNLKRIAVLSHKSQELELSKGVFLYKVVRDRFYLGYNHDGFVTMKLLENDRIISVPSYKTKDIF